MKIYKSIFLLLTIIAFTSSAFSQKSGSKIRNLVTKGISEIKTQKFIDAVKTFSDCLDIASKSNGKSFVYHSYECHFGRGLANYQMGKNKEAIPDLITAYNFNPNDLKPVYYAGFAYHRLKQYELSLKTLDIVISKTKSKNIAKDYEEIYRLRGLLNYQLKNYKAAIDEYTKAIKYRPKTALLYALRSVVYKENDELDKAFEDAMYVAKLDSTYKSQLTNIRVKRLLKSAQESREKNRQISEAIQKAKALIDKNQPQAALDFLNSIKDKEIAKHYLLSQPKAIAYIHLKQFKKGDEYFAKYVNALETEASRTLKKPTKTLDEIQSKNGNLKPWIKILLLDADSLYKKAFEANETRQALYRKFKTTPSPINIPRYDEILPLYSNNALTIAKLLRYENKHEESLKFLEYAIKANPNNSGAYLLRGTYYKTVKRDTKKAEEDYTRAVNLNPNSVEALWTRSSLYQYNSTTRELALKDISKIIALDPKHIKARLWRGDYYFFQHKYELAIADYSANVKKISETKPINQADLYRHYLKIGIANQNTKNYEKAILNFTKAIQITDYQNKSQAHTARAEIFNQQNKPEKAISDLTKAINIFPFYQTYVDRAKIYKRLRKYDLAIKDISVAIKEKPNEKELYLERGKLHKIEGNNNLAIQDFTKIIELDPQNLSIYLQRADIYTSSLAKYDLAISDYTKVIELHSKGILGYIPSFEIAEVYEKRAYANRRKGNAVEAINDYTKAIELSSQNDDFFNGRGLAYSMLKKRKEAIADFSKAIELNPNDDNYYVHRAEEYLALKIYKSAIKDINRATEIHPKNAFAYFIRGLANFRSKNYTEAISDFSDSIISPNPPFDSYLYRSRSYCKIGKKDLAKADEKKATELGVQIQKPCK